MNAMQTYADHKKQIAQRTILHIEIDSDYEWDELSKCNIMLGDYPLFKGLPLETARTLISFHNGLLT